MTLRDHLLPAPLIGRFWLLGSLLLVILPHLLRFPAWLTSGGLAVFAWRLLHDLLGWPLPGRALRWLLTFLGIGSVFLVYQSILGRDAGVALLTVMLCLKLIEIRTLRDAMIALFIGYFLVISGFLFSQSLFMGTYLFSVVLTLTAALTALNHTGANSGHNRLYLQTGASLLLQALPLMLVMFVLFPRLSGPLWSMPSDEVSARTGLSDSIQMGSITQLADSDEIVFRVSFEDGIPPANKLYWRGPVLWQTDGRNWLRLPATNTRQVSGYQALNEPTRYTVTLEPAAKTWLFALDLPAGLPHGAIPGGAVLSADYQLLSKHNIDKRIRYDISSQFEYRMDNLPAWAWEQALQLPDAVNPQSRKLATQWHDKGLEDKAVVQQALAYFAEQPFYYTRTPPRLGDHPVDEFLFQSRRGFCEHFATAFVTLMRAADIPARVVTGYQGGELNNLGGYLIVRQRNAHAWAEVWLDGQGWVRIDPTAAIPPERVLTTIDSARFQTVDLVAGSNMDFTLLNLTLWKLRHGWDSINNGWNQWVLGFDRKRQSKLLKTLGLRDLSWRWLIILMVVLLFFGLALIALSLLLSAPRQRDPVLHLYLRFCRKLEKAGIIRHPNEGPRDFARRVAIARADLDAEVEAITALYEALRYGKDADSLMQGELKRQVAQFRP